MSPSERHNLLRSIIYRHPIEPYLEEGYIIIDDELPSGDVAVPSSFNFLSLVSYLTNRTAVLPS